MRKFWKYIIHLLQFKDRHLECSIANQAWSDKGTQYAYRFVSMCCRYSNDTFWLTERWTIDIRMSIKISIECVPFLFLQTCQMGSTGNSLSSSILFVLRNDISCIKEHSNSRILPYQVSNYSLFTIYSQKIWKYSC